jgi:hypothetical protein
MGRRKAEDVLQRVATKTIRKAIREVRALKGLTNQDIADYLGWDARKVTSALVETSELRLVKAGEILEALHKIEPRKPEAQKIIEAAAPWLFMTLKPRRLPLMPAALIPRSDMGALAEFLAGTIAERTGAGKGRRERMRQDLLDALVSKQSELARYFVYQCIGRSPGAIADYRALLTAFGYQSIFDEIFLRRKG